MDALNRWLDAEDRQTLGVLALAVLGVGGGLLVLAVVLGLCVRVFCASAGVCG